MIVSGKLRDVLFEKLKKAVEDEIAGEWVYEDWAENRVWVSRANLLSFLLEYVDIGALGVHVVNWPKIIGIVTGVMTSVQHTKETNPNDHCESYYLMHLNDPMFKKVKEPVCVEAAQFEEEESE